MECDSNSQESGQPLKVLTEAGQIVSKQRILAEARSIIHDYTKARFERPERPHNPSAEIRKERDYTIDQQIVIGDHSIDVVRCNQAGSDYALWY